MSDRWYHQMACRDEDPDTFIQPPQYGRPPKSGRRSDRWAIPALLICQECPVRLQCLEEAVTADPSYTHDGDGRHPIIPVPMVVGGVLPWQLEKLQARRSAS